jgi:hypothetical protein
MIPEPEKVPAAIPRAERKVRYMSIRDRGTELRYSIPVRGTERKKPMKVEAEMSPFQKSPTEKK